MVLVFGQPQGPPPSSKPVRLKIAASCMDIQGTRDSQLTARQAEPPKELIFT